MRQGLHAHNAVLPEQPVDPGGSPLSALRRAKTIAVVSDVPIVERAPIVDLWLKAARRAGATIAYERPKTAVDALVTDDAEKAVGIDATHVYVLPLTPNGHGVADAWSAAGDEDPVDAEPVVVVISGDEAALNEDVRALASEATVVIGIGMFEESFRGIADFVLPGTSYLERDGTTINLEGGCSASAERCSRRCRTCSRGWRSSPSASASRSRRTPRWSSTRSRRNASAA